MWCCEGQAHSGPCRYHHNADGPWRQRQSYHFHHFNEQHYSSFGLYHFHADRFLPSTPVTTPFFFHACWFFWAAFGGERLVVFIQRLNVVVTARCPHSHSTRMTYEKFPALLPHGSVSVRVLARTTSWTVLSWRPATGDGWRRRAWR